MQSGEDVINGQSDHYLMWVEFEFFFDLNWVSLIQKGVLLIYKCFTNNGTSKGGLGWRFVKLAKVYVSQNGNFSLFHFSPFGLIFLDLEVILISLGTFPNHWNHSKRSSSKICKNGHKHIRGDMSIFLILVICSTCFTWARLRVNLVLD